jgi:hypothetical protein
MAALHTIFFSYTRLKNMKNEEELTNTYDVMKVYFTFNPSPID